MIRLIDNNMDDLIADMKAVKTRILTDLRKLRKKAKNGVLKPEDASQARQLEYRKRIYDPAHHRPVEVGRVVIDYQVLTKFEKKLKNCELTYTLDVGGLTVDYTNKAGQTGTLRLLDMRDVYKQIESFPRAEFVEPVLAE